MDSSSKESNFDLLQPNSQSLKKTKYRWIFLISSSLLTLGNYYCYDNPQALEKNIEESLNISVTAYSYLYSVYSYPNVILPFFSGLIIDKIGLKFSLWLFPGIVVLGQTIFMFGGYFYNFIWMLIGRIIYAIGSEIVNVLQSATVSNWFKSKELALALMLAMMISRFGDGLNSFFTPIMYSISNNLGFPLLIGNFVAMISLMAGISVALFEIAEGKKLKELQDAGCAVSLIASEDEAKFKDIINFKGSFWLININSIFLQGAFYTFFAIGNEYYQARFNVSQTTAGLMLSIMYLSSGVITPFFGIMVDKYGKRMLFLYLSTLLMTGTQILLVLIPNQDLTGADWHQYILPMVPLILLAFHASMYSATFYPSIPLLVDPKKLGSAFGVVFSVLNFSLAVNPNIVGLLHDNYREEQSGYFWVAMYFCACSVIGLICLICTSIFYKTDSEFLNDKVQMSEETMAYRSSLLSNKSILIKH